MTSFCGRVLRLVFSAALIGSNLVPAGAAGADPERADAERAVQAYLAMWSRDDGVNATSVARFYAPSVDYYGKSMSRSQLLADKLAYIRQWPTRSYVEIPGSMTGSCNKDRSFCKVNVDMQWRRVSKNARTVSGRARLFFEFVQAEGARKIARESAQFF